MTNSPSYSPCGRILLVDDNSLGLAARRSVLEELGHKVFTSGNADEALKLCSKHRFDVVVTDYKMPEMDGVELIERLKQQHSTVGVILISGFADTLGLNESNTGADIVIQKSANEVSHLIRSVTRLLRKQQQPKKSVGSQISAKPDQHKSRS